MGCTEATRSAMCRFESGNPESLRHAVRDGIATGAVGRRWSQAQRLKECFVGMVECFAGGESDRKGCGDMALRAIGTTQGRTLRVSK